MEADSDQRDNWECCNEASVGRALARQPNGRSGKKSSSNFSLSWVLWVLWVGTCEESEPVISLWCDSWEGTVIKLAGGLLFFLPFPCICGGHYITLHYFALLYITWGIFLYFTLHVCALWWQVVISLSRLLCGIQPRWLCGPYHDLLLVWGLLSCHSLSVGTV